MPPPPLHHRHRPRPPSCWEIAVRRATQARERRRRRRGQGGTLTPLSVVRDLLASAEGMVAIALMATVMTAAMEMVASLLCRPAQRPPSPPPSRRPAPPPASVHGHAGFEDAHPGETLAAYQARHRPLAAGRYRASSRTQALYLHRLLTGRARPSDRLAPALAEAVAGLDPATRETLALTPPERLVRLLSAIAAREYAVAGPPPSEPSDDSPEGDAPAEP